MVIKIAIDPALISTGAVNAVHLHTRREQAKNSVNLDAYAPAPTYEILSVDGVLSILASTSATARAMSMIPPRVESLRVSTRF